MLIANQHIQHISSDLLITHVFHVVVGRLHAFFIVYLTVVLATVDHVAQGLASRGEAEYCTSGCKQGGCTHMHAPNWRVWNLSP
jgi:hypothetical protein